ncbi:TonB-dependent receptor [Pedobacter sp. HMWF019]|uniref:SusC/RagA family TonB-linked outer membrane protein n=1 Tax=Pedobacter sp. HMWF019 TaxID=2056856 RepID=UPI000D36C1F2|nr:TonB-dependent receptor [Pedobacter sp. HMWF019]PTS92405.1 TonB-dependent receptor [Pedobacter sp. HMWF019]
MKRILLILFLLTTSTLLFSQEIITVKGVVRDGTKQAMPGVSIYEKGTQNAVVSASNGTYQIKVKANATLTFSYLGTKSVERQVNNRTVIDVQLVDDANNLNEVVVTGYGQTVARKDLTGSVSSIRGEELAKVPVQNIAQALQGRIAGMQVTMGSGDPGSAPSIKIRGGTSITQSNEPLYVVDGVPQTEGLAFLDPTDVESIDVLKDASATAIYGARGANGVVLVTTKKIKSGKTTINYDGYVGAKTITRYLPVLDPYQYVQYAYENALPNVGRMATFLNTYGSFDSLQTRYANRPGINWQKEVFDKTAISQYHKVGINGGSNEIKYNLFYSKSKNDGILLNSGSNKDIAKLSVVNNIGKDITVTGIVNYSDQFIYGTGGTQTGGNARLSFLQTLLQYRPINGKNNNDLDLIDDTIDPLDNQGNPAFQSPLISLNSRKIEQSIKNLNASATIRYNFLKNVSYNGLVSFSSQTNKIKTFIDATNIQAIRSGGPNGGISDALTQRLSYNNVITYANTFGKEHKMDVSIGQEYIYNYGESFSASAAGFPTVNNGFDNLGAGTIANFPTSYAEDDKLLSFFARANYSYKGRYLLSASIRRDGSSKFGEENVFGYFPSGALAWKINEEAFMKQFSAISDLKLRVSYGSSGNNRIANYAALGTYVTGNYPLNNQVISAVYQANLANPFLKWETVVQKNIGLDLGLFKQRIMLTTELYDNRSKDLLYNTRIPASSGFGTQLQNIGETSSKGIEFTLNTVNIRNSEFLWNTNFNIAFNKTKVLKLSNEENSLLTSSYNTSFNDYILKVGQPVGMMYGYISDGLYQVNDFNYNSTTGTYVLKPGVVNSGNAPQPGYAKYKDIGGPNGVPDGLINDQDRTIIGNANPKFTGGINNTFSYKGIDLSVFLDFTYGNDIYNANIQNNLVISGDFNSNLAFQANRWTNVGASGQLVTDPAELEALNKGKNTIASIGGTTAGRLTSFAIEDGSFLRINNISLGYTLPKKWLSKVKIANARIYVTAYNLHVFTKYSGYDPEVSVTNNPLTPGVDFSAYPRGRSFVAGLNLSL